MKKQLIAILFATIGMVASQSYGMQGNNYTVNNLTPDATINVAGIAIGPNVRNAQLNRAGSDQIVVNMPNNMKVAFRAPGSFSIMLEKLIDQVEPARLKYHLFIWNILADQIAMDKIIQAPPAQ